VLGPQLKMGENVVDEQAVLDARDDLERPAAALARFDVDGEDALQALHPGHRDVLGRLRLKRSRAWAADRGRGLPE